MASTGVWFHTRYMRTGSPETPSSETLIDLQIGRTRNSSRTEWPCLFGFERERSGIGHHSSEQFNAFLIGRNGISGCLAIFSRKNRVHAAIGRVADVAIRVIAKL